MMANRMAGIAIAPSITRMMTPSSRRTVPATVPMTRPRASEIDATAAPTASEMRDP